MAINFLNTVDLNKNQLNNAAIQNLTTDPAAGVLGQVYYNTVDSVLKICVTASTATPTNAVWAEVGGGVETLTTTDGTYIDLTPNTPVAGAVTVTADLNALDGTSGASERYLTKSNVWAEISTIPGTYSWTFDGDSGTTQPVDSGDTVTFTGSTKITTTALAGDELTIEHDLQTQTDSTSAASPAAGATFTVVDSVTRDTTGHATGLNVKTITLPTDTNTQTTYTLPVSAGTAVTGYTVADIDLTAAGESTGIASKVTFAGKNSNIAITETTGNNGIVNIALTTDVVIDDNLTLGGEISQTGGGLENTFASELNMSSQKITNVLDPTNPQDAATKQYVDTAVTGLLQLVGGFNANTGALVAPLTGNLTSGATRVAVAVGDYYVVTVDGDFFGNAATPLTVGDSVIVQTAAAAGASVEGDFIIVQSDTDLATNSTVGLMFINPTGSGITSNISAGEATLTNSDKGSSQNIFKNVASDSGTAVADNNNDTLSVVGAGSVTTAVVGDVLTITGVNTQGALGDRVVLTSGNTTGGLTTFAYNITSSFAGGTAAYVKCEVLSAAGQTVYADITRSGTTLNVIFAGTVADSDYVALLTYVG